MLTMVAMLSVIVMFFMAPAASTVAFWHKNGKTTAQYH
jgi:hypothetical protein